MSKLIFTKPASLKLGELQQNSITCCRERREEMREGRDGDEGGREGERAMNRPHGPISRSIRDELTRHSKHSR